MEISFWDVLTTFFLSSRGQLNCGLVHNEDDGSFGWLALQPIWKPDWRGRGGNLHLSLVALTHHRFRPKEFSPPISDDHHLNIGAASAIPWPFHPASATPNQFINNHEGRSLRMTRVGCSGIPSYYLKTLSGVLSSCCVSCQWWMEGVEKCRQRSAIREMLSNLNLKTKVINNSRIPWI